MFALSLLQTILPQFPVLTQYIWHKQYIFRTFINLKNVTLLNYLTADLHLGMAYLFLPFAVKFVPSVSGLASP